MAASVLFIGGTGVISAPCVRLAAEQGWSVSVLNRGTSSVRSLPDGVEPIIADVRDPDSLAAGLRERSFDVVCDFLGFTTAQVEQSIDAFRGRTGQYVYISSASAYQKPPRSMPVVEGTTLANPFWQYSRDKIACEEVLVRAWRDEQFPMTIVRPSHTYDETKVPLSGGWTMLKRIFEGREIVLHGDGTTQWTLTHSRDFARGFVGLLGAHAAVGEAFHITSDDAPTWNDIAQSLATAAGVDVKIVRATSEQINAVHPGWGETLLGDKSHSMRFDNTKLKRLVPGFVCTTAFSAGAREIVAYHRAEGTDMPVDEDYERATDVLVAAAGRG